MTAINFINGQGLPSKPFHRVRPREAPPADMVFLLKLGSWILVIGRRPRSLLMICGSPRSLRISETLCLERNCAPKQNSRILDFKHDEQPRRHRCTLGCMGRTG
jgi:hypothetical protein